MINNKIHLFTYDTTKLRIKITLMDLTVKLSIKMIKVLKMPNKNIKSLCGFFITVS